MGFGGSGLSSGKKMLNLYLNLAFFAMVLTGTAGGIYSLITTITQQMSAFGTVVVWTVGGIIYTLISFFVLYEVLNMLGINMGRLGGK